LDVGAQDRERIRMARTGESVVVGGDWHC
jgi:hypothetical protein